MCAYCIAIRAMHNAHTYLSNIPKLGFNNVKMLQKGLVRGFS